MQDARRFQLIGFFVSAYLTFFVLGSVWLTLWRPALEGGWGRGGETTVGVNLEMFRGSAPASPAQTSAPSPMPEPAVAPANEPQPAVEPQTAPEVKPQPQPEEEPKTSPPPKPEPKPRPTPKTTPKPRPTPKATPKPRQTSKATPKPRPPSAPAHPSATAAAPASTPSTTTESGASVASSKGDRLGVPASGPRTASQDFDGVKADRKADRKAFLRGLQQAISRYQFFPEEAARRRQTGTALVAFVLEGDGAITGIHVRRSSGSALLDEAAQETLRRLGRYRPIPLEFGRSRWEMAVPVVYELKPGD